MSRKKTPFEEVMPPRTRGKSSNPVKNIAGSAARGVKGHSARRRKRGQYRK